jgi:hypothetical protein
MEVQVGAGNGNGRIQSGAVGWGAMSDIHTIIEGPYRTGRQRITARMTAAGTAQAQWLVEFVRWGPSGTKMLDRTAAWLPGPGRWDQSRWSPNAVTTRSPVPDAVLARVEAWLRDRSVALEVQP